MKEIQNKLIAIYYGIYALFIIGFVLAHIFPLWFGFLTPQVSFALGYAEVIALLACVPGAIVLYENRIKKKVDIDYYFKWSAIEMLIISIPGFVSIVCYAAICSYNESGEFVRDRSSMFTYLIAFIALILTKPTKFRIEKYLNNDNSSRL